MIQPKAIVDPCVITESQYKQVITKQKNNGLQIWVFGVIRFKIVQTRVQMTLNTVIMQPQDTAPWRVNTKQND